MSTRKKYIMLFPAHADDVELQAAGILAKYLDKGYNAVYVMVTDNCAGGIIDEEERLSYVCPAKSQVIRHEETRESAEMFGLEPILIAPSSGGEIIHISPDTFVDISDYLDIKYRAFLKHKSQATQLRKILIKERASFWGKKIGVKYAEAFRTIIRGKLSQNSI